MSLGSYLGDIWVFDFKNLLYTQVSIEPVIEGNLQTMTVDRIKEGREQMLKQL